MTLLEERMTSAERRLDELEREIGDTRLEVLALRRAQQAGSAVPQAPVVPEPAAPPTAWVNPVPPFPDRTVAVPPPPEPAPVETVPAKTAPTSEPARSTSPPARPAAAPGPSLVDRIGNFDLLGARSLAIVGGVVMLLGVAFLFALAVNRGWIGPVARVGIGAAVSTLCVVAGVVVRRRLGDIYAAQAVVGVGIAGGFLTLLAATALYELIGEEAGLAGAAGIAAVATIIAWLWSSELLAGLGLIGALVVPFVPAFESGPTATGVAFAILMFAGTAAVAVNRRWQYLLAGSAGVLASHLLVLGTRGHDDTAAYVAVLTGGVALVMAGAAWALSERADDPLALSLAIGAGGVVTTTLLALTDTRDLRGLLLLGFAAAPALAGLATRRRAPLFAEACLGAALIASSVATADLLSGGSLTVAWAVEAAALIWLGARGGHLRLQLVACAYLGLALGNALAFEQLAKALFEPGTAASHLPSAVALTLAGVAFGLFVREPLAVATGTSLRALGVFFRALAAVAALYAVGLALVAASPSTGLLLTTVVWSIAGLVTVVYASPRNDLPVMALAIAWLLVNLAIAFGYDLQQLDHPLNSTALASAAVAMLLAGVALRRLSTSALPLSLAAAVTTGLSGLALAVAALEASEPGGWGLDTYAEPSRPVLLAWLGALAALYGTLAALCLRWERCRNVAAPVWLVGLGFLLWFEALWIDGIGVAAAFLATAAALAAAGRLAGEPRLVWTGTFLGAFTTLYVITELTPLWRFAQANEQPARHVWGAFLAAAAATVCAWAWPRLHRVLYAAAGALGLYALSLVVLGLAERVSTASVETDFQRGHTFVTAIWAVLGLALLTAGLVRRSRLLRFLGLGLFGISLAKLFVYDLSYLSSVTRSAAFLVVGALLLAGGALVQRLADRARENGPAQHV